MRHVPPIHIAAYATPSRVEPAHKHRTTTGKKGYTSPIHPIISLVDVFHRGPSLTSGGVVDTPQLGHTRIWFPRSGHTFVCVPITSAITGSVGDTSRVRVLAPEECDSGIPRALCNKASGGCCDGTESHFQSVMCWCDRLGLWHSEII